ncbi:MAG: TonB-dependent receptor [Bacteroidota bacterium]
MKRLLLMMVVCFISLGVASAQSVVTGTVSDDSGSPLEGVAVLVKGTTIGIFTDAEGKYSLQVPANSTMLVYSLVGMASQEVAIEGRKVLNVTLGSDPLQLEEVIVTGYGTQTRRNLTSSIAKVTAEEIAEAPVNALENALQGRLAGVNIGSNSGALGSQINVRVRGIASINANNQPLYVIDGIIIEGIQSRQNFGGPGTNPLVNLNPSDISSVEVLKDAAATAIYGARGSNGVIQITTKRGQPGKAKVNVNYYAGFSEPTDLFDVLTGNEYAGLWNRAAEAVGSASRQPEDGPSTDWQDLVVQTAFLQEANGSVSGSNGGTSYFFSTTYRNEDSYIRNTNLRRLAIRANIDQQINDKLKVGISLAPSRVRNRRQNEDNNVASPITYGALIWPNVESVDDNGDPLPGVGQFNGTPLSNVEGQKIVSTSTQLLSNIYMSWDILDNLNFRTEVGTEFTQVFDTYRGSSITTDGFPIGTGSANNSQRLNNTVTGFFTYTNTFGSHGLKVTLGSNYQRSEFERIDVSGNTFADDRLQTLDAAAEITGGGGFGTRFSFQNNFLRANYAFEGKYLVSVIGSYNGSSRFGADNRYGFFPAASVGWIISDEDFLADNNTVNYLKLRGSFGITGNAEIGNFDAAGLVSFGRDYNGLPGYEVSSLANSGLSWEETAQLDIAVEFGLFENRISGTVGFFQKNTEGLLFDIPQPLTTGIATSASQTGANNPVITTNTGEIRNSGFELELSADIFDGDFKWTIFGNLATISNEVISLPDNDGDGEADDIISGRQIIRVGEELGAFYVVEYAGVDRTNGDAQFFGLDAEGNRGTASSAYSLANRQILGSQFPDFFGGITNNFSYKGFTLSAFWQFSQGNDIYRNEGRFVENNLGATWNQLRSQLDAWTPENPDSDVPQARLFTQNGGQHSSRYLDDGSYWRLKTTTLAYTFPRSITGNVGLRLYTTGFNLITITDYKGLDPEANNDVAGTEFQGDVFFSRPQSRMVVIGANVSF